MPPNQSSPNPAHLIFKACEDMGALTRDQMDATIKSAAALSKGLDEIMQNTQHLLQDNISRSMTAGKTMMNARTLPEITDMQQELMKEMFETWVAVTGKLSQISARLTQEVMAPMSDHANNAIGKMTQKMRAA